MTNPYKFNWEPMYRAYLPELAEMFMSDYEGMRDRGAEMATRQFSCVAPKYVVDPERYGAQFWSELVLRFQDCGRAFHDELMGMSKRFGRRMPWPGALATWIYKTPNRFYDEFDEISYLKYLLDLPSDAERKTFITFRVGSSGNQRLTPSEVFAHRLMFGEYEAIIEHRSETANALYELMGYTKRCSLEGNLVDRLVPFFSAHFPDCLRKTP